MQSLNFKLLTILAAAQTFLLAEALNVNNVVLLLLAVMTAWTAWKQKHLVSKVDATAAKVDTTAVKVEEVHKLTNGNMGEQLKIGMVAAKALALQTGAKEDIALAEVAKQKVMQHEMTEAKLAAEKSSPPEK